MWYLFLLEPCKKSYSYIATDHVVLADKGCWEVSLKKDRLEVFVTFDFDMKPSQGPACHKVVNQRWLPAGDRYRIPPCSLDRSLRDSIACTPGKGHISSTGIAMVDGGYND